ncbi:hypothetical protein VTI28DRAFT_7677 [Corynascus sepedonium]
MHGTYLGEPDRCERSKMGDAFQLPSPAPFLVVTEAARSGNSVSYLRWGVIITSPCYHKFLQCVNFVYHSLGRLVYEDELVTSRQRSEPHLYNILQIAFLGTLHYGSGLARWAELLLSIRCPPTCASLTGRRAFAPQDPAAKGHGPSVGRAGVYLRLLPRACGKR